MQNCNIQPANCKERGKYVSYRRSLKPTRNRTFTTRSFGDGKPWKRKHRFHRLRGSRLPDAGSRSRSRTRSYPLGLLKRRSGPNNRSLSPSPQYQYRTHYQSRFPRSLEAGKHRSRHRDPRRLHQRLKKMEPSPQQLQFHSPVRLLHCSRQCRRRINPKTAKPNWGFHCRLNYSHGKQSLGW